MVITTKDMRGKKVMTEGRRRRKKIGKVTVGVFHPTKKRLVGYLVKRPDVAGMVKREDRFLAFDRVRVTKGEKGDEIEPPDEEGTWDKQACKRLGIDYERCVVWEGMPMRTTDDKLLGYVDYVGYDPTSGKVAWVACSESAGSRALLGITKVPGRDIKGYADGAIQLKKSEDEFVPEGGLAAKAGAASVKTKQKAGEVGKKASVAAHKAGHAAKSAAAESLDSWHEMFHETKAAFDEAREAEDDASREDDEEVVDDPEYVVEDADEDDYEDGEEDDEYIVDDDDAVEDDDAADEDTDRGAELARKFGRQLHRAGGMFSAFKEEYDREVNKR